jgi:HSP20 family protein
MGRQFDDASHTRESQGPFNPWAVRGESMALDLLERNDAFVVSADLPGFKREDIDIQITDRTLRIEAERETVSDDEAERFLRHERRHESTRRSLRLPEAVDTTEITAEMNNGVLTITLPKLAVEEAHTIEIEGEGE